MAIKNRETLKNYFKKGGVATEKHFIDLVESSMNLIDDGISMSTKTGLKINPIGASSRLMSFFKKNSQKEPEFTIDLNKNGEGLSYQGDSDKSILKLNKEGKVGVNTNSPEYELDVNGTIGIKNRVGTYKKGSVDANGKWQTIVSSLDGIMAFEIVAKISGKIKSGNYCIAHAIALSTFGGKSSKSNIKTNNAYFGSYKNKVKLQWTGDLHNYQLQIKSLKDWGINNETKESFKINFNITSLLES